LPLIDPALVPEVPLAFQNEDHRTEARLLNEAVDALDGYRAGRVPAADVLLRLDALVIHTREHFAREEGVMRESGFPAFAMHKGEHDRVLAHMRRERDHFRVEREAGRLWAYLTEALPVWFVGHIQTMDLVTGRFVASRSATDVHGT
jgi:hemerythrin